MRAPEFWSGRGNQALPRLLSPLAALYGCGGYLRGRFASPYKAKVPIVCIGNLVAGGAGKTPVALAVIERLRQTGMQAHALTRGYGGRQTGPLQVELDSHTSADVGDEALLLARNVPTWVSADRPAGARAAARAGADVIVMDDGFQNPSLTKDISLLVIDSAFGFGNGRVLPAGPLREPVARGIARADAIVLLGAENPALEKSLTDQSSAPLIQARLVPGIDPKAITDSPLLAFAGIGRPEKFYASLREISARIVETRDFPDHHAYTDSEIEQLLERATDLNAVAITTEKDAVRLSAGLRARIRTLPIRIDWQNPAAVDRLLAPLTKGRTVSG